MQLPFSGNQDTDFALQNILVKVRSGRGKAAVIPLTGDALK
jgi:hypothetical protein